MPIPDLFISPLPSQDLSKFGPDHWNEVSALLTGLLDGADADGTVLTRDAASSLGAIWTTPASSTPDPLTLTGLTVTGHASIGADVLPDNVDFVYPVPTYNPVNNILTLGQEYTAPLNDTNVAAIQSIMLFDPSANSGAAIQAFNSEVRIKAGNDKDFSNGITSFNNFVYHLGTGALTGATYGTINGVDNGDAGTMANAVGSFNFVENDSTGTITLATAEDLKIYNFGAGAITTAYGLRIEAPAGGGPITTYTAIHIENAAVSGVGAAWAINYKNAFTVNGAGAITAPGLTLPSGTVTFDTDVIVSRAASGVLALRNSTNAQALRIYNTESGGDAEYATLGWVGNQFYINIQKSGSGTYRDLVFATGGNQRAVMYAGGTIDYSFTPLFATDYLVANNGSIQLSNGSDFEVQLKRVGGTLTIHNGSNVGAALRLIEQAEPAAPADGSLTLWAKDAGGGKTALMVRFPSGASQQVTVEL